MTVVLDKETLSPKQAKQYLEANEHNRNLRPQRVKSLVGAIKRGEWKETGDSIKFNGNGNLIDGQHRLQAIAEAGRRVPVWIARGVEEDVQEVVDTGSKRTLGDMLKLRGYEQWNALAAATRSLWEYQKHGAPHSEAGWTPPTAQELLRLVEIEPLLRACVTKSTAFRRQDPALKIPNGPLSAMWVVFTKVADEEEVDAFFAQLLAPSDPAPRALRKRLLQANVPSRELSSQLKLALLIKTWNAWIRGEPTKKQLIWRTGGKAKEPFPKVEGPLE